MSLAGYCDSQLTDLQENCFGMFLPFLMTFTLLLLFSVLYVSLYCFSASENIGHESIGFYKNEMVFMLPVLLIYKMTINNFLCRYKTSQNLKGLCVFVSMNSCACHWDMGAVGIL